MQFAFSRQLYFFQLLGGIVKYSLGFIDDNPDLYIPKTKNITI